MLTHFESLPRDVLLARILPALGRRDLGRLRSASRRCAQLTGDFWAGLRVALTTRAGPGELAFLLRQRVRLVSLSLCCADVCLNLLRGQELRGSLGEAWAALLSVTLADVWGRGQLTSLRLSVLCARCPLRRLEEIIIPALGELPRLGSLDLDLILKTSHLPYILRLLRPDTPLRRLTLFLCEADDGDEGEPTVDIPASLGRLDELHLRLQEGFSTLELAPWVPRFLKALSAVLVTVDGVRMDRLDWRSCRL